MNQGGRDKEEEEDDDELCSGPEMTAEDEDKSAGEFIDEASLGKTALCDMSG